MNADQIATEVVDAALAVHRELGPGLLESTYEACLEHELLERGLQVGRQIEQPVHSKNLELDAGYRLDLLINDTVIIELKAVDQILPIHQAQLLTYLKLSKKQLGFLINFNIPLIKHGIKRMALGHSDTPHKHS